MNGLDYLEFYAAAHARDVAQSDPEVMAWADDAPPSRFAFPLLRLFGL